MLVVVWMVELVIEELVLISKLFGGVGLAGWEIFVAY
jgi:hypothetical protein